MRKKKNLNNALDISFSFPSKRWKNPKKIEKEAVAALIKTQTYLQKKKLFDFSFPCQVSVVFSHNNVVRCLNAEWRSKDKSTNVLSFPSRQPRFPEQIYPLGDIILAYQTIEKEAKISSKPFLNHLIHLIIHGFLHLCHFDHENDDAANEMEKLEIAILKELGIPDPYKT